MSHIGYLRIYTDENDCSHFEEVEVSLSSTGYAPPAPNLNTSTIEAADKYVFLDVPVGWYGDWHPSPVRQWMVLMSGECELEVGDGEKRIIKAGDLILLDDTSGKGHQTKVLGDTSVRILAVHF